MIEISNWFQCNRLTLNYGKTHFLQFLTKKQNEMQHQIVTSNSVMTNINSTKFLGLIIDNTLSWKNHITEITPKLNKACFVYNTTPHTMTKFMPYAVLFGRKANLPGHLFQKFVIYNYDDINSHIKFYFNFLLMSSLCLVLKL